MMKFMNAKDASGVNTKGIYSTMDERAEKFAFISKLIMLFIIAVLANSQMDVISFRPAQAWFDGWWIASNWHQSWLQKYLLGMTVDGWHLLKFIMLSSFILMITISNKLKWYWYFILMTSWGLLFNLLYQYGT